MMAPLPILRGALHVLFVAGCATRNWTLADDVPNDKVNALWEALHEVPSLVTRWGADSERELLLYLDDYDARWPDLHLRAAYEFARDESAGVQ